MKGYVELLEAAGFKKGRVDTYTRADAVYYKRIKGPECNCNQRSPSLGVNVYLPTNFELSMYGELKNGTWLRLNLYSINEQQLNSLNYYVRLAEVMWEAAFNIKEQNA